MSTTRLFCTLVPVFLVALILTGPAARNAIAETDYRGVVTIYNKTNIPLNYQLRAYRNGAWTEWSPQRHKHPRGGWFYHWYNDPEQIQIRFDRIGGDGEFTQKIYNLKSNRVVADQDMDRYVGRPYYFSFDAGGQLLDLYKYGW